MNYVNIAFARVNTKAILIHGVPPTTRKEIIKYWDHEAGSVKDVLYNPIKAMAHVFFNGEVDPKVFQKLHFFNGRALKLKTSYFPDSTLMNPQKADWYDRIA